MNKNGTGIEATANRESKEILEELIGAPTTHQPKILDILKERLTELRPLKEKCKIAKSLYYLNQRLYAILTRRVFPQGE